MAVALGVAAVLVAATPGVIDTPSADAAGRTFTVDSTGDGGDAAPGDGNCAVAEGACTLRAAIDEANAWAGHDTIEFNISGSGPHTIRPGGDGLDWLTDVAGVTIDGYTQPGAQANTAAHGTNAVLKIQLEGQGYGGDAPDGLELRSPDNVIRGLAIYDFRLQVRLVGTSSTDNLVVGNFIGTNAAASFADSGTNSSSGVHLQQGASRNTVGTSNLADRNLISGIAGKGIAIYDPGTNDNVVRNNVIGLAPNGVDRLANRSHGIDINVGASRNIIGGSGAREGNVISGNGLAVGEGSGIEISHDASSGSKTTGNEFIGNFIGTTADGNAGTADTRNGELGINFEGNEGCRPSDSACPDDIAFNAAIDNVIVGSRTNLVLWKGANQNLVRGNRIGVLANGAKPASATFTDFGVLIEVGANRNLIEQNEIAYTSRGVHMRAGDPSDGFNGSFAVYGNRLSRNAIYATDAGLGIDLIGPGDSNTGPSTNPGSLVQGGIGYPTIARVSTASLTGRTCGGCRVEVFVTPAPTCSNCDADFGRGKTWVADGRADRFGRVNILFRTADSDPYVVAEGQRVTMSATDAAGNTSEFSRGAFASDAPPAEAPEPTPIVGSASADGAAVRCSVSPSC